VLALLIAVLVSGCELREGAKSEYGDNGLDSKEKITELFKESPVQNVRKF
jgi:hypothetical protein